MVTSAGTATNTHDHADTVATTTTGHNYAGAERRARPWQRGLRPVQDAPLAALSPLLG